MMEVFDFNKITGFPYSERHKNVLYRSDEYKIRVIDLPENGKMPECEMATHVVFVVMQGNVDIMVNGKEYNLSEKQIMISDPAVFSMKTSDGAKLMGIQIQKHI